MAPVVGQNCKLYRNTGTAASPTWVLLTAVGDVAIPDLAMGLAELKRRGNNFTKNLPTMIQSFTVDAKIIAHMDTTNYAALKTNFLAGTIEEYAVMNGLIATTGNMGMRVALVIQSFPFSQAQEEVFSHDLKLAVAYWESPSGTEVDPSFYTV